MPRSCRFLPSTAQRTFVSGVVFLVSLWGFHASLGATPAVNCVPHRTLDTDVGAKDSQAVGSGFFKQMMLATILASTVSPEA